MKKALAYIVMATAAVMMISYAIDREVIDLRWNSFYGTTNLDSAYTKGGAGATDTTQWFRIDSVDGVGTRAWMYCQDDTVQGLWKLELAIYDRSGGAYIPLPTMVTLDSLSSGVHTGSTKRATSEPLYFRANAKHASYGRLVWYSGATIGHWGAGGAGTKRTPYIDALIEGPDL